MAENRIIDLTSGIENLIKNAIESNVTNKTNDDSIDIKINQRVTGTNDVKNATKALNDYSKAVSNISNKDLKKLNKFKFSSKKEGLGKIDIAKQMASAKPGDFVSLVNAYRAQYDDWESITEDFFQGITKIRDRYNKIISENPGYGKDYVYSVDRLKNFLEKYKDYQGELSSLSIKLGINIDEEKLVKEFEERRSKLIEKLTSLDKGKGQELSSKEEYELIINDRQSIKEFMQYFSELEKLSETYGKEIPERIREIYDAIQRENKDGSLRIQSDISKGEKSYKDFIKSLKDLGFADNIDLTKSVETDIEDISKKLQALSKKSNDVFDKVNKAQGERIHRKWEDEDYYTSRISNLETYIEATRKIREELNTLRAKATKSDEFETIDSRISLMDYAENFAQDKINEINEIYHSIDFATQKAQKESEKRIEDMKESLRKRMLENDDFSMYGEASWISNYTDQVISEFDDVDDIYERFADRVRRAKEDYFNSINQGFDDISGSGGNGSDGIFNAEESIGDIDKLIELLNQLLDEIRIIGASIGSIDEESGIPNLITQFDNLIQKINELQDAVSKINFNVVINDPNKDDAFWNKQLQRYREYYQKAIQKLGGQDRAFSAIDQSSYTGDYVQISERFTQQALDNSNLNAKQIIQNYQEFFKYLKEAAKIMAKDTDEFSMAVKESIKGLPTADVKALYRNEKNAKAKEGVGEKADAITQAISEALSGKDKEEIDLSKNLGDLTGVIEDLKKIQDILNQIADNKAISENVDRITLKLDSMQQSFRDLLRNLNESVKNNQVNLEMGDASIEVTAAQRAEEASENIKVLLESLEKLNNEVAEIRKAFGTIDSESGITSLLSQFNELSEKIDTISSKLSHIGNYYGSNIAYISNSDLNTIINSIREIRELFNSFNFNNGFSEYIDRIISKLDSMKQSVRDLLHNLRDAIDNINIITKSSAEEPADNTKEQKLLALISELKNMVGNIEVMPSIPHPRDFINRIDELLEGYFTSIEVRPDFNPSSFIREVDELVEAEITSFSQLADYLTSSIPDAIEEKNNAFKSESTVVSQVISDEIEQIKKLEKELRQGVPKAIQKKNEAFREDSTSLVPAETNKASEAIISEGQAAEKAAIQKLEFVSANGKIADSGSVTAENLNKATDSLIDEGNAATTSSNIIDDALNRMRDSIDRVLGAQDSFTNNSKEMGESALSAAEKLEEEMDVADALFNVLSTQRQVYVGYDGTVKEPKSGRQFTAQTVAGRKLNLRSFVEMGEDGEILGYSTIIKEQTNYVDIVRQAAKAIKDLQKAEHDLSIEQAKDPSSSNIQEYVKLINEAQNRLDAATTAAHRFAQENEFFINDKQYGSDYLMSIFNRNVSQLVAADTAKETIRYNNKLESSQERAAKQIDSVNDKLSKQLIAVNKIQSTYDQSVAPGVSKPVSNTQDLAELEAKRQEILTKINNLQNTNATADELREVRELVAEYQLLAIVKKNSNNPTKREMGGQKLDVAISQELAFYDELIDKSKQYGSITETITESLEKQRKTLETTKDVNTLYNSQDIRKDLKAQLRMIEIAEKRKAINAKANENDEILGFKTEYEFNALAKYEKELDELGLSTDETRARIDKLFDALANPSEYTGLRSYSAQLKLFKQEMSDSYNEAKKRQKEAEREANKKPKEEKTTISDAEKLNNIYDELISKYKTLGDLQKEAKSLSNATETDELIRQKDVLKQIRDIEKDINSVETKRRKLTEEIGYDNVGRYNEYSSVKTSYQTEQLKQDEIQKSLNNTYEKQIDNLKQINALRQKNVGLFGSNDAKKQQELSINQEKINALVAENKSLESGRKSIIEQTNGSIQASIDLQNKLNNAIAESNRIESETGILGNAGANSKVTTALKSIVGLDPNKYLGETRKYLEYLQSTVNEINNNPIDFVNSSGKQRLEEIYATLSKFNATKNASEFLAANEKMLNNLELKIRSFMQKNSGMGKEFMDQFESLRVRIDTTKSKEDAAELVNEFLKLQSEVTKADKLGKSFFKTIGEHWKSLTAQWVAQYLSFQDMIRYARTAFETIHQLDTALVDLKKTTTMSNSELEDFYHSSSRLAKQMGVSSQEIIAQASAWSRLGYNTKETSETMAELSSQFAKISPGTSVEDATDYLVSTMKAFDIDVTKVESDIMDSINRIGNTMATSNQEVGEMLKRSSAAMAAANNSLAETIALESAAVQITRNAETTGTAFRTISMRIRGYDEETEELLEDYEELKGAIADLTKTAKTPGGISLFTDESKTEFKSTYQLLKEIAEIYHDLTDKQQAQLLEKLAGKRGGQVLAGKRNCLNVQKCI